LFRKQQRKIQQHCNESKGEMKRIKCEINSKRKEECLVDIQLKQNKEICKNQIRTERASERERERDLKMMSVNKSVTRKEKKNK